MTASVKSLNLFSINRISFFFLKRSVHSRHLKCLFAVSDNFLRIKNCTIKRGYMDLTSVIKIFEEQVPPTLAESWDNTGLLVEPSSKTKISTVFLTNDLTEDVLNEAISQNSNLIISYHPPIFAPIKSFKQSNWKDRIIVKCIENSIAVYSPHTCCDAVADGVNDWLIKCFDLQNCNPIHDSYEKQLEFTYAMDFKNRDGGVYDVLKSMPNCVITDHRYLTTEPGEIIKVKLNDSSLKQILRLLSDKDTESTICVTSLKSLPLLSSGMGRVGTLVKPLLLEECISMIKKFINLNYVRFACGISHTLETPISVVAVCAGSGSSILKGVKADLYITGEMSHHDLLDAIHHNVSVVLCEHSNSERGYLKKLVELLSPKLVGVKLVISASDKDPVTIV